MEMIAPYSAVADAARPYESRWTLRALAVVDRALYDLFRDQQRLWEEALITGTDADIQEQTGCMCRGWAAITRRMEEAGVPDNAYMIGVDPKTGTRVAIGDQVAARDGCARSMARRRFGSRPTRSRRCSRRRRSLHR